MDETLAELFAHHPSCHWFEGNPMDAFYAVIEDEEYGAERRPSCLVCTGGGTRSCSIQVSRDEPCERTRTRLTLVLFPFPGIDYMSREIANNMLLVEHHSGESEMSDGEYECRLWPEDQLCPATGGRVFTARMAGTGYIRRDLG
jgi:hypothetical protein